VPLGIADAPWISLADVEREFTIGFRKLPEKRGF